MTDVGIERTVLVKAVSKLDTWLQTMRQPGGYGGPVAHWWQHCMIYTGPGIDWRYEGILVGYHRLYQKTGQTVWKERLVNAVQDVLQGQREDGSYICSQFEMNPGTLGTPHEAAATLGLLTAFHSLNDEQLLTAARANLNHLIYKLWDDDQKGFNDRPGIRGRVPNKLATLSECFMEFYDITQEECYLDHARLALDTVLTFQTASGAMHQYGDGARQGDNKFFPFYNARCVPPLVKGAYFLRDARYIDAARRIVSFLSSTMDAEGSWDQIVYPNHRAYSPRWIAGAADILRAYQQIGTTFPMKALLRIIKAQLPSGGFPTAEGFARQFRPLLPSQSPTFHDVIPVVGWNDKIFRFLIEQLSDDVVIPVTTFEETQRQLARGVYQETADSIRIIELNGTASFEWNKKDPWSQRALEAFA